MTQADEILQILIERGPRGLNSFEPIRNRMRQLPFVIQTLEERGYKILAPKKPDTSVQYTLVHIPPELKDEAKRIAKAELPTALTPQEAPTPSFEQHRESTLTLRELESKLLSLREEYRNAPTVTDQKIIEARGRAIRNAIYQLNPNHPSLLRQGEVGPKANSQL